MALSDITLADGQASPVSHVFTFVSTANGRVIRSDLAASPETPLTLTHAHSERKAGTLKVASHLLRIDKVALDADNVTQIPANIRVMADVPSTIYSDALADDFAAFIRNWATSANVRAWLRGSVG